MCHFCLVFLVFVIYCLMPPVWQMCVREEGESLAEAITRAGIAPTRAEEEEEEEEEKEKYIYAAIATNMIF